MKAIGTLVYLFLTIGFALGAVIAFAAALVIRAPIGGSAGNAQPTLGIGAVLSVLTVICLIRLASISSKNKPEQSSVKPPVVPPAVSLTEIEQPKISETHVENIPEVKKPLTNMQIAVIFFAVTSLLFLALMIIPFNTPFVFKAGAEGVILILSFLVYLGVGLFRRKNIFTKILGFIITGILVLIPVIVMGYVLIGLASYGK